MSNFYLQTNDGKCWLAQDSGRAGGRKYRYYHMVNGYHGELVNEKTMVERYGDFIQYTL